MIEIAQTYHFWNVGVCSKLFPGWFRIVSRVTEINNTCCVLFCYPFGPDWMYTLNFLKSRAPTKCWLLKCCYNFFFIYIYLHIFQAKITQTQYHSTRPFGKKNVNAYGLNMQQWENRAKLDEYMCASKNIVDISRSSTVIAYASKNKWIRHEANSIHDILTFYWALSSSTSNI